MIRYGQSVDHLERLPLTAALGQVYMHKSTGTLRVLDGRGEALFVFWFKRGFPCFSWSRDGLFRLGELLEPGTRKVLERLQSRPRSGAGTKRQLVGQLLLGESVVSMDELQAALSRQLESRLLCCAAMADAAFEFDDGMDEFGMVPLSSPLVNPMETAARCAASAPYDRARNYLLEHVDESHVQLARDRRIPPAIRPHLAGSYVDSLAEPQDVARAIDAPSRMRTLCFLHSFGFVETLNVRQAPEVTAGPQQTTSPRPDDILARLSRKVARKATWYELLDIPLSAPRERIKQAYRNAAFVIHPDRVPAERMRESQEVFGQLVEAYHILGKERLRVKYDRDLVVSGAWTTLGDAATVAHHLAARHELLSQMGLTTLASEYDRMNASLTRLPPSGPEPDFWTVRWPS